LTRRMPDTARPGVSIVIPSWNGLDLLKQFLPSVIAAALRYREQSAAPVEIIIVNDGSADATSEWLAGQGFVGGGDAAKQEEDSQPVSGLDLRLLVNLSNIGFGKTCNRGFAAARYRLVFLINNDVEVSEDAIRPLAENFAEPRVFAAHCRVFEFDGGQEVGTGKIGGFSRGFIRVHRSYVTTRDNRAPSAGAQLYSMFATGGSAMFDRDKFLGLGAFDPLLSPIYWEDVDISYRAWKRGYEIVYEPRSVVRHRVSSTMRRVSRRKIWRLKQRNRLIYHWVNLHDRWLMASHILWVLFLGVTAPLRFQPDFISAVADALKKLPDIRLRRREEKRAARLSDRDVFEIFKEFEKRMK
jgi:GT2 family glycosyltransferase